MWLAELKGGKESTKQLQKQGPARFHTDEKGKKEKRTRIGGPRKRGKVKDMVGENHRGCFGRKRQTLRPGEKKGVGNWRGNVGEEKGNRGVPRAAGEAKKEQKKGVPKTGEETEVGPEVVKKSPSVRVLGQKKKTRKGRKEEDPPAADHQKKKQRTNEAPRPRPSGRM